MGSLSLTVIDVLSRTIFVTSILHVLFALIVGARSKDKSKYYFVLATLAIGVWAFANFLIYRTESAWALRLTYTTGVFVTVFLFVWVRQFLNKPLPKGIRMVLGIGALLFCVAPFVDGLLISNIVIVPQTLPGFTQSLGPFFALYSLFHFVLYFAMLISLCKSYKATHTSNLPLRRQIRLIGISIGLFIGVASVFNFILPFLHITFLINFDVPASIFLVGLLYYAVTRYDLFNSKIVLTHSIVFFLWIILLIQLSARGFETQHILDYAIFLMVVGGGVALIRSVEKEVRQREKLEQLTLQLRNFLSFATHELRGPVAKFKSVISMIFEGDFGAVSKTIQNVLRDTYVEAEDMGLTIDMFLNVNRLEVGEFSLNKRPDDIVKLVHLAIEQARYVANRKNIDIVFKESSQEIIVPMDFFYIQHVFKNIIGNAIKYTSTEGIIVVTVEDQEHMVSVRVADNGIGMKPEDLETVFTKYSRMKDSITTEIEGHGIGMWLSKHIVEMHGGRLWAESAGVGKGSTFVFLLPKDTSTVVDA